MNRPCEVCGVRWANGSRPCRRCQAAIDGRPIRAPRRDWTMGELARLRTLRARGQTFAQCAAALNRSRGAIETACIRYAVEWVPPPGRRGRGELMRSVARLVRRGNNDAEIADVLGVSRDVVRKARGRCGLPPAVNWNKVAKLREAARRSLQGTEVNQCQ